jgi:hypothetical protein
MHVAFRDGYADRDYHEQIQRQAGRNLNHICKDADAGMGGVITGCRSSRDRGLRAARRHHETDLLPARLRLYPQPQRRGLDACGACVPTVLGSWQYEGGGAFHNNGDIYKLDKSEIDRRAGLLIHRPPLARPVEDRPVLTGDAEALQNGPPVTAMLVQNTNPANVMPEQALVRAGAEARGPVHGRPRAVHDRHGATGRCRAAGDDVPGA